MPPPPPPPPPPPRGVGHALLMREIDVGVSAGRLNSAFEARASASSSSKTCTVSCESILAPCSGSCDRQCTRGDLCDASCSSSSCCR
eukprot:5698042-Pleurochrysis_carterae.AAC.3